MACSHGSTRSHKRKQKCISELQASVCIKSTISPLAKANHTTKLGSVWELTTARHVTIFHGQLKTLIQPIYYNLYSIFSIIECRVVCLSVFKRPAAQTTEKYMEGKEERKTAPLL